jgi:hypothetical protein
MGMALTVSLLDGEDHKDFLRLGDMEIPSEFHYCKMLPAPFIYLIE